MVLIVHGDSSIKLNFLTGTKINLSTIKRKSSMLCVLKSHTPTKFVLYQYFVITADFRYEKLSYF